jgi:DNA-binding transcriptional ArsR family regulator
MPQQNLVAQQLAEILSVIAHPQRIRIIEELGLASSDVHSLAEKLKLRQSTVSQHLAQLRSKGITVAVRDGRSMRYSLTRSWLADWLLDGFQLLELQNSRSAKVLQAAKAVKKIWKRRA